MNPLFVPVKLVERILEDLTAIADAARRLPTIEEAVLERVDALLGRLDGISDQLGELRATVAPIQQLAEVRKGIEPLDEDMRAVRESIDGLEPLVERIAGQMTAVDAKLDDMRGDLAPLGELADKVPGIGRR